MVKQAVKLVLLKCLIKIISYSVYPNLRNMLFDLCIFVRKRAIKPAFQIFFVRIYDYCR